MFIENANANQNKPQRGGMCRDSDKNLQLFLLIPTYHKKIMPLYLDKYVLPQFQTNLFDHPQYRTQQLL